MYNESRIRKISKKCVFELIKTEINPILAFIYIVYYSLFFPMLNIIGTLYYIFATLPIVVSAIILGLRKGLLFTVLTILINVSITLYFASYSTTEIFSVGFYIGTAHLIILTMIIGHYVDMRKQLDREKQGIEEMQDRSRKLEAIGEMIGGISHEFNNLLAIIVGNTELLYLSYEGEKSFQSDEEFDHLVLINEIIQASDRATNLIIKLKEFSETNNTDFETIDVTDFINELVLFLDQTIGKSIILSKKLISSDEKILGNKIQLFNALLNLALNAKDAMPDGGNLNFETRIVPYSELKQNYNPEYILLKPKASKYMQIVVSDTGHGMTKNVKKNLFNPFFNTKNDTKKGVGLGLSAVYGAVKNHQGVIGVKSELGKGSYLSLSFPVIE